MRGETGRQAPRAHVGAQFPDAVVAIQKDEVDGELHEEGVYRLTGNDPQAFSASESLAAKQAFVTPEPGVRDFKRTSQKGAARFVCDLKPNIGEGLFSRGHETGAPSHSGISPSAVQRFHPRAISQFVCPFWLREGCLFLEEKGTLEPCYRGTAIVKPQKTKTRQGWGTYTSNL
jgi:hypothetical protein